MANLTPENAPNQGNSPQITQGLEALAPGLLGALAIVASGSAAAAASPAVVAAMTAKLGQTATGKG